MNPRLERLTRRIEMRWLAFGLVAVALVGCVSPAGPSQQTAGSLDQRPQATKKVTIALTGQVSGLSIMRGSTTTGGVDVVAEIHSNGLITSDYNTRRPIGQLAERVPSLEDGSVALLPDGGMRVVYSLRKGVTWQDGAPFTARDLVFSHAINSDSGLPFIDRQAISQMGSVEAPDDHTFVIAFRSPYYRAATLGVLYFWPLPQHLLGEPYERYRTTGSVDEFSNLPYWTSEFVNLGPFRLTSFDPGEGMSFQAYNGYFQGRPKLDVVRVQVFADPDVLLSSLLAGAVDIFATSTLRAEGSSVLRSRWHTAGEGTVHVVKGGTQLVWPQHRPSIQNEPANLQPRVRAALYQALDRETLSEALNVYRENVAWALLAPDDEMYEATRDGFRPFTYDPDRARAILRDAGWAPGPDGVLRHSSDGRRYRISLWDQPGREESIAAIAGYWRQIGIETEEHTISSAQVRDNEHRAQYPSWERTSSPVGHGLLSRISDPPAGPQNRWAGNRGGYDDPRARDLVLAFRQSVTETDQLRAMKAISDFVVAELPILTLYYSTDSTGVRRGVKALDDVAGGQSTVAPYGTYTRNSHLWDLE